jgi:hypothetical protein
MAANLERVATYYRRKGIPFDPARGLEVERVIATRPDWAVEHALLPEDFHDLLAAASDPASAGHSAARHRLALVYALNGAYRLQTDLDLRAVAAGATDAETRERLAYGLVKLGREEEAIEVARAIGALGGAYRDRADRLLRLAREHRAIRALHVRADQERDRRVLLNRLMAPAFPARAAETWALEYRMRTEPAREPAPEPGL